VRAAPERARAFRRSPDSMKRLRALHTLLSRRLTMDDRRAALAADAAAASAPEAPAAVVSARVGALAAALGAPVPLATDPRAAVADLDDTLRALAGPDVGRAVSPGDALRGRRLGRLFDGARAEASGSAGGAAAGRAE
jgi:hypothetical protein